MNKNRLLIVDDELQIRTMLEQFFTELGYSVMTAASGQEALDRFTKYKFDCVISDLVMPEMDGLTLLKQVKEQRPGTVFFLITGYGTIENAVQGMKDGAYDFIAKPFRLEDMKMRVERVLLSKSLENSVKKMSGILWAFIISIPLWLILGIILGMVWKRN